MFDELDTDLTHGTISYQTTIGQNSTYVDILPLNGQISPGSILSSLPTGTLINDSTANALAGLVEVNGTFVYAVADALSLSPTGGVGARNDYFSIVNPRLGSGIDADDAASTTPGAASLQQNASGRACTAAFSRARQFPD